MAERRPLIILDGMMKELPIGDTVPSASSVGLPVFVQQTEPTQNSIWYQTDESGTVIDIRIVSV